MTFFMTMTPRRGGAVWGRVLFEDAEELLQRYDQALSYHQRNGTDPELDPVCVDLSNRLQDTLAELDRIDAEMHEAE